MTHTQLRSYIHLVHCEHNSPSLSLVKIATKIATLYSYVWCGHTKGHWISVYIRTGFCDTAGLSGSGIFAGVANACTREQTTSFSIPGQSSACLLACKWTGKRAARGTDRLCSPQQQDELAPRGCHADIRLGFIIWAARWRTNTLNPSLLCFKWSAVIHNSNKCSWLSPDIA